MSTINAIYEACAALGLAVKDVKYEVGDLGRVRVTVLMYWPSGGEWSVHSDWAADMPDAYKSVLEILSESRELFIPEEPGDTPIRGDT